ncbi:DEAD/DEAH box helicase [Noviherbaspirillum sp. CPCC 100848]|uniref:DEAD/DEAH box helicase n=1 Tax=Noviherbaspirillum album TaxID=3080276 RepID=A0ABU6JAA8_9BURK|nr:DEAD/DEAH box helicase [Noviherbaspirillum sp. CPCC 100848]MEC4720566.1 DEAD/DEAH box helicase [Noviherbaspirillum sp. CPCC 100848]
MPDLLIDDAAADHLRACTPAERTLVTLLALHGEPLGKVRLLECLRTLGAADEDGQPFTADTLAATVDALKRDGLLQDAPGNGYVCRDALLPAALHAALDSASFGALCRAVEGATPVGRTYDGYVFLRSYRQALARLRMAMLQGLPPEKVAPWLETCTRFPEYRQLHPHVVLFGQPFDAVLFAHLHPAVQDEAMACLLAHAQDEPETFAPLRDWTRQRLSEGFAGTGELELSFAEQLLLCGQLDEAAALLDGCASVRADFPRAAILSLRGDQPQALTAFEAALKSLRKETGKRNIMLDGPSAYLFVLAMLRSGDARHRKLVDAFLPLARRNAQYGSLHMFNVLQALHDVQAGAQKTPSLPPLDAAHARRMLPRLFHALVADWLGQALTGEDKAALIALQQRAQDNGYFWVAAQAAGLLARLGEEAYSDAAVALRRQHSLDDVCDWFEQKEPWERQLEALMELRRAAAAPKTEAPGRLVWLIAYDAQRHAVEIEPREQHCDAAGQWGRGRPVALKRLRDEHDAPDFLTPQDREVIAAIGVSTSFYRGASYDIDNDRAVQALVGHPLVFWQDQPDTRVELVQGEIELLVTESGGKLRLCLQPPVDSASRRQVMIVKETPARLRIYSIRDEHRQIAAIIDNDLMVPAHAREQLLRAVGAVSTLVTVHSDLDASVAEAAQVDAEERLHVHLIPYGDGLKMQILVKPFGEQGPAYQPGRGGEQVIAEVEGRRLQARRALDAERAAAAALAERCPALNEAVDAHGDWYLASPDTCLELLMQLQACDGIALSWPHGERFRVVAEAGPSQMHLTVKSERDWFAAQGKLRIDDKTVLDLRSLLFNAQQRPGRFVPLDGNRFIALTEELHRRIAELAGMAEMDDAEEGEVRIHPLAAGGLEEFAAECGAVDADAQWKHHLERMRELEMHAPQLPGTLRADLRDYQLEGFQWLSRLASWGVGACLADDMGLGKTIQTLALLLQRAPQGPALVVAPTSVCLNWLDEAARFAPTLKIRLFGGAERAQLLEDPQAFDVIVASYGLLQQEAERFAGVRWHTVVLDEAQAIKNAQAKRSQAAFRLQADFRLALSGTPVENHLGELWSLFRFINPGLLGSAEQFNDRFALPIERHKSVQSRLRLRRLIQPFILRRTKVQVLTELPARTEMVRHVDLSPEETALYEALRRSALERIEKDDMPGTQKAIQIVTELMKLRRACCHPDLVAPELHLAGSKLAVFGELLDELLENRHKALVFSQFVDHLGLVRAWLDERGIRYQYLDGGTPMAERKRRVDAFQRGEGDVFLISLKAGGTGLNLTAADYVIHLDPWWNPAVEDQASDRAHRIGQQRPVTIYRLIARHTVEEGIVELHQRKRELADSLLEGSEAAVKLSADEMLELLRLERGRLEA